jgi:hypothetical protein
MNWIKVSSGLFVFGAALIYAGTKVVNYNTLFIMAGAGFAVVGFFLLKKAKDRQSNINENEFLECKNKLKKTGQVIEVNLDECEIISNQYKEEKIKKYETKADELIDRSLKSGFEKLERNDVVQSVIVFRMALKGELLVFQSPTSLKDSKTLHFHMISKKSAKIYVDKNDATNYYFDLEFI